MSEEYTNDGLGLLELEIEVRDKNGKPTGKRKSIASNSGAKLWDFFVSNQGKPKRKRSKKQKEKEQKKLPSGPEAKKILQQLYKDTGKD